jgi:hypothetical protein
VWNLDDDSRYFKLLSISIPHAETWGGFDREKRERIRAAVIEQWSESVPAARWWALRLYARKAGAKWDIENIPKLVVDAFSAEQLAKDSSSYPQLGLYQCDTIECVRMVQVAGEPCAGGDSTLIEIYGAR